MRKLFRSAAHLPLLLVILCITQDPIAAQEQKPIRMKPMGKEAFQVLTQFFEYDRGIPLDAAIVETVEDSAYIREKIVYTGVHDSRVPGYLAIPKTGTPPYPCVLLMHGGGGSKSTFWDTPPGWSNENQLTQELLAAGYAVLALDAQYHGERIADNDYEGPMVFVFQRKWHSRGRDMIVQSTVEHRRAIDYLATRPEIDTTRIGALGHSLGGMTTFYLTAVEPRIKVAVPCITALNIYGSLIPDVLAPWHYARAVGDRPLLMLMSSNDPLYLVEDAQRLFKLIKGSTKDLLFYDVDGHWLPEEYIPDAIEWFKKYL